MGKWQRKHLKAIEVNYAKAPYYKEIMEWLEPLYMTDEVSLSNINKSFIISICDYLGINTVFTDSSDYEFIGDKTERLVNICRQAGGTEYVSGKLAMDYIDPDKFDDIKLTWFEYDNYPEYPQMCGS